MKTNKIRSKPPRFRISSSQRRPKPSPSQFSGCRLTVSMSAIEFARDSFYFIELSLDNCGEKKRTEVSAYVSRPIFKVSSFIFFLEKWDFGFHRNLNMKVFIGRLGIVHAERGGIGIVGIWGFLICHLGNSLLLLWYSFLKIVAFYFWN